ncbi:uncharacterized protein [Littorina saxatilis]|uniref:uncharacterized protein isoform X2 n=1 Tax=Littorina saxatilis TaxID=31220 RepID=UPI0038B61182
MFSLGPTTGTDMNSPQDTNPTDAPVEAIVGGAVAAFVVVIVIVVVVIIVRRKRRREHSGKDASHEHQENGTGVALEPSQNADDDTSAGPPEFGIYAFPGGDEPATIPDNTPAAEEDDVGMYAAPKQDVYAAVDKSKPKKNKPAASDHLDTSQATTVTDEYAVVNKASKKKEASNSSGLSEVHIPENNDVTAAPVPYIYAQVDKTAKPAKTAVSVPRTPDEDGATYA